MRAVNEINLRTDPVRLHLANESPIHYFGAGKNVDLMQFTGLLDKNGKEIYEGDILEAKEYWGERDYAEVVWNERQLQWYLTRNGEPHEPLRSPFADGHMAFEIVGNIYEYLIEHPSVVAAWLSELGLTIDDLDRGSANTYAAWIRTDTAGDMTFDLRTKRGDKASFRGIDGIWTRVA